MTTLDIKSTTLDNATTTFDNRTASIDNDMTTLNSNTRTLDSCCPGKVKRCHADIGLPDCTCTHTPPSGTVNPKVFFCFFWIFGNGCTTELAGLVRPDLGLITQILPRQVGTRPHSLDTDDHSRLSCWPVKHPIPSIERGLPLETGCV